MKLETNKNFDNLNLLIYSFQISYDKKIFFVLKKRIDPWMKYSVRRIFNKFPKVLIRYEELLYFKDVYFLKILLKFNINLGIPFDNFLIQYLKWNLFSKLKTFITLKQEKINYSVEYNENNYKHFKNKILKIEERKDFDYLKKILSSFENIIFDYKMKGYKNLEISTFLNIKSKKINNTWYRIKTKLKRYIIFNNLDIL